MKCKRRKAVFGLDDAIMLIGTAITAGTQINNAIQNKKNLQAQQRAQNMANIDEQNSLLQQNLGTLANNRDYIDDRQNQIVLKTRNDNQLKYGGDDDKYAARDNTRTQFVPGTGYVPNAKLNKNTGKDVQYDTGPLGFVPVVGDVLQGGQAVSDFKNKNYKRAALNAGLLFLPNVIERLGKPVGKAVINAAKKSNNKKIAKTINNLFPERIPDTREIVPPEIDEWLSSEEYNEYDRFLRSDEYKRQLELQKQQRAAEYLYDIENVPFKYGGSHKYHKRKRC